MEEKELQEFLEWVPSKIKELAGKPLQEIAKTLNSLYQTDNGKKAVETLILDFKKEKESPNMFKKGGKIVKKCKCGCDIVSKKEKGGVIESCACGCKTDIVKAQEGVRTKTAQDYIKERAIRQNIPLKQHSADWGSVNFPSREYRIKESPYLWEVLDNNGTLHRQILEPYSDGPVMIRSPFSLGPIMEKSFGTKYGQKIRNWNSPAADTTYTDFGNKEIFNKYFKYKKGGVILAKNGSNKVTKEVEEGIDEKGNRTVTKTKTISNDKTGRTETKVKTRTYLPYNRQQFEKNKTLSYQSEDQVPNRFRSDISVPVEPTKPFVIGTLPTRSISVNTESYNTPTIGAPVESVRPVVNTLDNLSFSQAFAKSRKEGLQEFTWKGKRYGTKYATEVESTPKSKEVSKSVTNVETKPSGKQIVTKEQVSASVPDLNKVFSDIEKDRYDKMRVVRKDGSISNKGVILSIGELKGEVTKPTITENKEYFNKFYKNSKTNKATLYDPSEFKNLSNVEIFGRLYPYEEPLSKDEELFISKYIDKYGVNETLNAVIEDRRKAGYKPKPVGFWESAKGQTVTRALNSTPLQIMYLASVLRNQPTQVKEVKQLEYKQPPKPPKQLEYKPTQVKETAEGAKQYSNTKFQQKLGKNLIDQTSQGRRNFTPEKTFRETIKRGEGNIVKESLSSAGRAIKYPIEKTLNKTLYNPDPRKAAWYWGSTLSSIPVGWEVGKNIYNMSEEEKRKEREKEDARWR